MYKLPFKQSPQPTIVPVGDPETGILEFPKLYDLTPNERLFIKEAMTDEIDIRFEAVNLAKELAAKNNQPVSVMFDALTSRDTEVLSDHLEVMLSFADKMEKSGEKRITATVTALIKFRILPDWTLTDTNDVEQLLPKLRQEIYNFSEKEASGWAEEEAKAKLTDVDLGKSQTAPLTVSQTGQDSIGDSESSAPTKSASMKKTLATSPAG